MKPNTYHPNIISLTLGLALLLVPSQITLASDHLQLFSQLKKAVVFIFSLIVVSLILSSCKPQMNDEIVDIPYKIW